MEQYYLAYQCAKGNNEGVVKLTKEGYKAVERFLDQVYSFVDGDCRYCCISTTSYDTEEEALAALNDG